MKRRSRRTYQLLSLVPRFSRDSALPLDEKMKKLHILLFAILSISYLHGEGLGGIEDGEFKAPQLNMVVPVDETWTIGLGNEGDVPPLLHRISEDQVLTIMFMNDRNQFSGAQYAEAFKKDLSKMPNFKELKGVEEFETNQKILGYEYKTEGDDSDGLKYRYGITHIRTLNGVFTAISVTEASESPEHINKALQLMRGIEFDIEILPTTDRNSPAVESKSSAFQIGEKIGEYTVYTLVALVVIGAIKRTTNKKSNNAG